MKSMFRTIALAAIASLAFAGCIKHEPSGHRVDPDNGGNGREKETLVLSEQADWGIAYAGRGVDEIGVYERFKISYNGHSYVYPLIISPEDLSGVYANDLAEFFSYEVGLLQQNAKDNSSSQLSDIGVYASNVQEVFFNRHIHGTWIAYLVELDVSLKMTGKYAENTFTIQEEEPTEAFKRWFGKYRVSDLEGHGSFDIEVSDADANYLYYVDGWETGRSVSEQMNQERDWVYARFADGKLVFYAQFLTTEEYNGVTVDQVFAGTYLTPTSDGNGDLDWEGVDYEDPIASTVQDGDRLFLTPTTVSFDNGYELTYNSMRYSRLWFTDDGNTVNWAFYNTVGVPALPAEMTAIPATRTTVSAPAVRLRTKGTVHRDQLKPVRTSRPRKSK